MAVGRYDWTIPGGVTPTCTECGLSLCWDIDQDEYDAARAFWDAWICECCNGGVRFNRAFFEARQAAARATAMAAPA